MDIDVSELTKETETLKDPPLPAPGWLCVSKLDVKENDVPEPQVQQVGPGVGLMLQQPPAPGIVSAAIVLIGNETEEFYEQNAGHIVRNIPPFAVGNKVYFREDRGLEITGYIYIQWDSVICFER